MKESEIKEYFQSKKWVEFKVVKAICDVLTKGYVGFKKESEEE